MKNLSRRMQKKIINICIDLYKKAAEENQIADLETILGSIMFIVIGALEKMDIRMTGSK